MLEGEHVVVALEERPPSIVDGIAEHPIGEYITESRTVLGEDVLGGQVVQGWVSVEWSTRVPFTILKRSLQGGNIDFQEMCIRG